MAEPARRGQRPARSSGLTSPDRSASRNGRHGRPNPPPRPGTRTSRRTGERQDDCARIHFGKLLVQESDRNRSTGNWPVDRGLGYCAVFVLSPCAWSCPDGPSSAHVSQGGRGDARTPCQARSRDAMWRAIQLCFAAPPTRPGHRRRNAAVAPSGTSICLPSTTGQQQAAVSPRVTLLPLLSVAADGRRWQSASVSGGKRPDRRRWLDAARHPARRDGAVLWTWLLLPWVVALVWWLPWHRHHPHHVDSGVVVGVIFGLAAVSIGLATLWVTWAAYRYSRRADTASRSEPGPGSRPAGRRSR